MDAHHADIYALAIIAAATVTALNAREQREKNG
jgi:hypothetical protein